jgi:hypothetical protein
MSKETIKTVADTILMSRERLIGSVMIQNSRETVRKRLANRFLSALKRQLLAVIRKRSFSVIGRQGLCGLA